MTPLLQQLVTERDNIFWWHWKRPILKQKSKRGGGQRALLVGHGWRRVNGFWRDPLNGTVVPFREAYYRQLGREPQYSQAVEKLRKT